MQTEITIIGAGMAGLACARRLARAGHTPLLLDKGRGIGGRMATRRTTLAAGDVSFDKGGCAAVVAPTVRVERGGIGIALARRIEVGEGGRVLLRPGAAAALGIGLGIGFGLAVAVSAAWAGRRAPRCRP